MKKGSLYVNSDINKDMARFFKKNFNNVQLEYEQVESWTEIEPEEDKKKIVFLNADNEGLPFLDNTFDSYIANFSLHIVDNPKAQLLEAKRVLKEGGIAGFTVWGRPEKCRMVTFLSHTLQKLGYEWEVSKDCQGGFRFSDINKLREEALEAGFKVAKIFTSASHVSTESKEDYIKEWCLQSEFDTFCEKQSISKDDKDTIWNKVLNEYDLEFGDDTPNIIDFETNVLIAHK